MRLNTMMIDVAAGYYRSTRAIHDAIDMAAGKPRLQRTDMLNRRNRHVCVVRNLHPDNGDRAAREVLVRGGARGMAT